jgi:hypothetical protein
VADPDYGVSFRCLEDLDPLLSMVSGQELMNQQMVHRLYTPTGSLLSDPNAETLDVREFISKGMSESDIPVIQSRIQACLLDDERINTVNVQITFNGQAASRRMTVYIRGTGALGPFSLTLSVSSLTVELLRV